MYLLLWFLSFRLQRTWSNVFTMVTHYSNNHFQFKNILEKLGEMLKCPSLSPSVRFMDCIICIRLWYINCDWVRDYYMYLLGQVDFLGSKCRSSLIFILCQLQRLCFLVCMYFIYMLLNKDYRLDERSFGDLDIPAAAILDVMCSLYS